MTTARSEGIKKKKFHMELRIWNSYGTDAIARWFHTYIWLVRANSVWNLEPGVWEIWNWNRNRIRLGVST